MTDENNIEPIRCSSCRKPVVRYTGNGEYGEEFDEDTFFEISRFRTEFRVEDGGIYEGLDGDSGLDRNVKMERILCKECFDKILNESKTMGDLFRERGNKGYSFIY